MNLFIDRDKSSDQGTPGQLSIQGPVFGCVTLELPWRNNESGKSCIEAGTYAFRKWYSPHLQAWVLRLEDKNGRSDCLIHMGNFAGDVDKGLETQVHGCTLVGADFADLPTSTDESKPPQLAVLQSRNTLRNLLNIIDDIGPHFVTYRWKEGGEPEAPEALGAAA